jgi:hypothetical protein
MRNHPQVPVKTQESILEERPPPHLIREKIKRWALSGYINLREWRGAFKGEREVVVKEYDKNQKPR